MDQQMDVRLEQLDGGVWVVVLLDPGNHAPLFSKECNRRGRADALLGKLAACGLRIGEVTTIDRFGAASTSTFGG